MIIYLILYLIFIVLQSNCDLKREELSSVDLPTHGFGKYVMSVRYIGQCEHLNGPIDNEALITCDININKLNETYEYISGKFYMPKTIKIEKAKMTPQFQKKDGSLTTTLNRTTVSPCSDFIMSFPLKLFFSPDKNCIIKQGNYTIDKFSIDKWSHMSAGDNYMYARLQSTIQYYSKSGLIFCIFTALDSRPIPKLKRRQKVLKKSHRKSA